MYSTDAQRPDPDSLLAQVQEQERQAKRGKLRIYFGASAGVGKTYAMLAAAQRLLADKQKVVVGVVETHGRSETESLLHGLEVLPLKTIDYRGKALHEFDIDAALRRQPSLVLVDELAHSNVPGSRHPKRWQDVEELLNVGIDVFTTVNVQHLESLNDVVGGITGIRVSETLPDTVFDKADEIVLVDIPADELLKRLREGKVYQAQQADRASKNFFRKGNLIALRELALRRTAERIEDDVQAYRIEKSIGAIWKTDSALLVCVGPCPGTEHIIRSTAQLASQLNTEWHAIYVETPQLQRLPRTRRDQILKTLKLAQDLGATPVVLSGSDIALTVIDYAHAHNFSRVILGRHSRGWSLRRALSTRIAAYAPEIDLIEIGDPGPESNKLLKPELAFHTKHGDIPAYRRLRLQPYLWTIASSVLTALIATPLLPYLDLANIVMLFLLTLVFIAVQFGRGPAILSAFMSVAAFDFFFVSPRFSFSISDFQYVVTLAVMLAVGLIIGQLTAGLRYQARVASRRESRSRALYEFARELSGALQTSQIFESTRRFIQRTFDARTTLLLPDDAGHLQMPTPAFNANEQDLEMVDMGVAQWAFDHASPAGMGTDTLPASRFFYLPLQAPMRTRGILAVAPRSPHWLLVPEQRQQLEIFAALAAIALERVHYIDVAQDALLRMESERLRNSLLSALSHDLRTPLTSLLGLSESLASSAPPLTQTQHELANALHEEAQRMTKLVTNLLDMARLQSGEIRLNLQWQPFEEVVGSALRASQGVLARHKVRTQLAPDLPLVRFDAVLIERVLCNLVENASKYTREGSLIVVAASVKDQYLEVTVSDNGPGFPPGREEAFFEKFTRGEQESSTPGVGLGLAICRAIVQVHNGVISAQRSPQGGAVVVFTLPLGTPPGMPDVEEGNTDSETVGHD